MKTKGFLLILFMFLVLTGCTNQNSQKPIVAKIDVKTLTNGQQYTFSIVQTKGSSTQTDEKTTYAGIFDLVVQDNKGAETSRQSLNQYFDNKELLFNDPVNLIESDYNADNLFDIPIGFPVGDGSDEYKYVLFSIGKSGKVYSLPAKGYKEDGYIYSEAAGYSTQFPTTVGVGERANPKILTGVEIDNGSFEPAKYVWDGQQFKFEKENPFLINAIELNAHDKKYIIKIVQTEYKKPLKPEDQDFNIYVSKYRGYFDLLIEDSDGVETSRISLNKYFGNDILGFGGPIQLIFKDYNKDGNYDFAIGRLDPEKNSPEFQYVLFSVNSKGILNNLMASGYKKDGFIYSAETQAGFPLLTDGETGIEVTVCDLAKHRYATGKYLWDGSKFVFSN